jgi:serine-type D-Ala-D-Ala carboxypeptidase (penicillin-binding protein 5/6)
MPCVTVTGCLARLEYVAVPTPRFLIALAGVALAGAATIPVYASVSGSPASASSPSAAASSSPAPAASGSSTASSAGDQYNPLAAGQASQPTVTATPTVTVTPTPTESPVPGPPGIKVAAGALENATTGKLLWSDNINKQLPIGSIVKVMTAIVVIKAGTLNRVITVPKSVIKYLKSQDQPSVAGLIVGDKLTTLELLEAMLLPSGCDAAYTLANAYGPGINAFIATMNTEAAKLGLTGTHFTNFDGMPWPTEHSEWSTPANLITMGTYAMRFSVFRDIVGQSTYTLTAGDGHHAYKWQNANPLIGTFVGSDDYRGAIGIKTGDTKAAKLCLLFEAVRNGVTLIGVTLGTPGDDINETGPVATKVLNWGFAHL